MVGSCTACHSLDTHYVPDLWGVAMPAVKMGGAWTDTITIGYTLLSFAAGMHVVPRRRVAVGDTEYRYELL